MYIFSIGVLECVCSVSCQSFPQFLLILFTFGLHMLTYLKSYIGYDDGASRSTQNLSSVAWAIFAPNGDLVSMQGICIGHLNNNIVEYNVVVELLSNPISHGICRLVIKLDSRLKVLQLVNVYLVRNPTILHMVLIVRLLETHFNFIQYEHI